MSRSKESASRRRTNSRPSSPITPSCPTELRCGRTLPFAGFSLPARRESPSRPVRRHDGPSTTCSLTTRTRCRRWWRSRGGSNPEIRRTIVGQMLEYAAHAARTWTADTLRQAFEESTDARSRDPREGLRRLLEPDGDGEPDADGFSEHVATNLATARLRLLFVADDIPDPLERAVEFLNAQMDRIEVLAVEVKQFKGDSRQTLVPRVIGRTAAPPRPRPDPVRVKLDRESGLGRRATASRFTPGSPLGRRQRHAPAGAPRCWLITPGAVRRWLSGQGGR